MAYYEGPPSAAALSVAGWCALSLGRWELADGLALRSLDAAPNTLAERVREMVAGLWLADVRNIESDFDTEAVRRTSGCTDSPHRRQGPEQLLRPLPAS